MRDFLNYLFPFLGHVFLLGMVFWAVLLVLPQAPVFGYLLVLTEGARAFPALFLACSVISIVIVVSYGWRRCRGDSIVTLLAMLIAHGFQLSRAPEIFKLPRVERTPVEESSVISLAVANVELGRADGVRLLANLKKYSPEVFVVTEITPSWIERSNVRNEYPYRIEHPSEGAAGIAVYAKQPLQERVVFDGSAFARPIVASLKDGAGQEVWLIAVHPPPPSCDMNLELREKYFQGISELRRMAPATSPIIVAGDFNATPFSSSFRELLMREQLVDVAWGMFLPATWQNRYIGAFIDHILVSGYSPRRTFQVLEDFGSDHFPVFVKLFSNPNANGA